MTDDVKEKRLLAQMIDMLAGDKKIHIEESQKGDRIKFEVPNEETRDRLSYLIAKHTIDSDTNEPPKITQRGSRAIIVPKSCLGQFRNYIQRLENAPERELKFVIHESSETPVNPKEEQDKLKTELENKLNDWNKAEPFKVTISGQVMIKLPEQSDLDESARIDADTLKDHLTKLTNTKEGIVALPEKQDFPSVVIIGKTQLAKTGMKLDFLTPAEQVELPQIKAAQRRQIKPKIDDNQPEQIGALIKQIADLAYHGKIKEGYYKEAFYFEIKDRSAMEQFKKTFEQLGVSLSGNSTMAIISKSELSKLENFPLSAESIEEMIAIGKQQNHNSHHR